MLLTLLRPRKLLAFALVLLIPTLFGCQTVTPKKGLTPEQVTVLQQQGFVQNDEGWEFGMSGKVLFENDVDTLNADSIPAIKRIGTALLGVGISKLRLEGHADAYGEAQYNRDLSLRRAESVAQVLISIGMHSEDITVRGFGKSKPVADNTSAVGRMENRRVSIIVPVE